MSTPEHYPVTDWATDFDHTDPEWVRDPYPIWADLRERCPVAHTDRFGGAWLPTRYDDISAIAYDTEHFSSQGVIVTNARPRVPAPVGPAPPITSDPPFHQLARRVLLPAFAPKAVTEWEPATRALCRELLDALGGRDVVDAAVDYAQHIPVGVIARMLGLPEDGELFRGFVHEVVEAVSLPSEERSVRFEPIKAYIDGAIDDHIARPRDDLIGYLLGADIDGQRLSPRHVRGTIELLIVAGIDTTWSAIGASIWHFARSRDDRRRLVDEPQLIPIAVEELLRAFAPVTMARLVAKETEMRGCLMKPGDWVFLPFPAANRDPEQFDDADRVVIDRTVNPHAAFGLGIHRCIGSNLARMELRVAVEEWFARFPDFELADASAVTWAPGQARGPRSLPVRILTSTARPRATGTIDGGA
jgi:cytochrome P450